MRDEVVETKITMRDQETSAPATAVLTFRLLPTASVRWAQ